LPFITTPPWPGYAAGCLSERYSISLDAFDLLRRDHKAERLPLFVFVRRELGKGLAPFQLTDGRSRHGTDSRLTLI
jgi:hypothetical protein